MFLGIIRTISDKHVCLDNITVVFSMFITISLDIKIYSRYINAGMA